MTQLALVIDLNVCVGCHACVTSCKQWNTSGWAGPMSEWGTRPVNHYLPRRKTRIHIDADELTRANNPLRKEDLTTYTGEEALDDVAW